jgi:hypothetical protein
MAVARRRGFGSAAQLVDHRSMAGVVIAQVLAERDARRRAAHGEAAPPFEQGRARPGQ